MAITVAIPTFFMAILQKKIERWRTRALGMKGKVAIDGGVDGWCNKKSKILGEFEQSEATRNLTAR
jgi:hypothetical protein